MSCPDWVDGAPMDKIVLFGLKVIFVITLIIGPVSADRTPTVPGRPRQSCQDFSGPDRPFLGRGSDTYGMNPTMTMDSGHPVIKCLLR
jgi:hypothetical protein